MDDLSVEIGRDSNWFILRRGEYGRRDLWSLNVELRLAGLSARTSVWLGPKGVQPSLANFFDGLAADWRG